MEPLQYIATRTDHSGATAFSALPDAAVVPPAPRRVLAEGSRRHLAAALRRLADALAPAAPRRAWASPR